jgi:23S rRNA U2552 (ribose-2'-O)-methylase RlmE/FtsJ
MRRRSNRKIRSVVRNAKNPRSRARLRLAEILERRDLLTGAAYTASMLGNLNPAPGAANPTAIVDAGNTVFFTVAVYFTPGYAQRQRAEN